MLKLDDFRKANRILILGDAGSGKSTLAIKLGHEFSLPVFHCDDILWQKKYSIMRNRGEAINLMDEVYAGDKWCVDGTTRDLLETGIKRADVAIFICFESIFKQYSTIIKRHFKDKHETLGELFKLLIYVTKNGLAYPVKTKRHSLTWPSSILIFTLRNFRLKSTLVKPGTGLYPVVDVMGVEPMSTRWLAR